MRRDSARENARRADPATLFAAGALCLLLFLSSCSCLGPFCQGSPEWAPCPAGTVGTGNACRLRQPNYHACTCTCPRAFDRGANVQTPAVAFPASSAGGPLVGGEQLPGSGGTIIGGPGLASGSTEPWWQVDFDADPDGWLPQAELAVVDTLATKTIMVCLPPELNPNLSGSHVATAEELESDCSVRAATRINQLLGAELRQACSCTRFVNSDPTGPPPPDNAGTPAAMHRAATPRVSASSPARIPPTRLPIRCPLPCSRRRPSATCAER